MTSVSFIAQKLLFSRGKRSLRSFAIAVAVGGIFFASVCVLLALGILSGFQKTYERAILGFNAHFIVFSQGNLYPPDQQELETFLNQQPGISYSPYLFYESLLPTKQGLRPVVLKGVNLERFQAVYPVQVANSGDAELVALLGKDLRKMLMTPDASVITLIGARDKLGKTVMRQDVISVQGTFSTGLYDFDSQFIMMDIHEMQRRFFDQDFVGGYEIRLDQLSRLENVLKDYHQVFHDRFDVLTWSELNHELLKTLKMERSTIFLIAVLVMLIACLNIFGFNFLFFIDKKQEFLVLAALGADRTMLRRVLHYLSFVVGGGAVLVGSFVSLAILCLVKYTWKIPLDAEVYYVDHVPVEMPWEWVAGFMGGAVLLCWLTGIVAGSVVIRKNLATSFVRTN